jgi:hypothetical protein
MKLTYVSILLLLLSCRISINSKGDQLNDFRTSQPVIKFSALSEMVKPYQFVEITADDLKSISNKNVQTLIYQLAPWCSPCISKFKKDYHILDSIKTADPKTAIFVVSNSYGFERQIEKLYKSLHYSSPIYVMANDHYGNEIEAKVEKFTRELCDTCTPHPTAAIFLLGKDSNIKSYAKNLTGIDLLIDNNRLPLP